MYYTWPIKIFLHNLVYLLTKGLQMFYYYFEAIWQPNLSDSWLTYTQTKQMVTRSDPYPFQHLHEHWAMTLTHAAARHCANWELIQLHVTHTYMFFIIFEENNARIQPDCHACTHMTHRDEWIEAGSRVFRHTHCHFLCRVQRNACVPLFFSFHLLSFRTLTIYMLPVLRTLPTSSSFHGKLANRPHDTFVRCTYVNVPLSLCY